MYDIYKGSIILLLFIGILLVVIEVTRVSQRCPESKIIYRYIPRTFEQEQNEPVYPSDIFKTMFTQPSPWIAGLNDIDNRKIEDINKFFVSQI